VTLRVQIDKQLEQKFREFAMKKFGYSKGALSKAAEEAFIQWTLSQEKEKLSFNEDPVEAIDGLLSNINIDSVTLQHEAQQLWAVKVLKNVPS
jgi:hypothetical protein